MQKVTECSCRVRYRSGQSLESWAFSLQKAEVLSVLKPYLCRCMLVAAVLETGYEWVSQLRSSRTKNKLADGSGRRVRCVGPVMVIATFALWVVLPARAQQPAPADSKGRGPADQVNVNWLYGAYVPKDVPLVTLALRQRLRLYVAGVVLCGPSNRRFSSRMRGGLAGYGRRFGSRYGRVFDPKHVCGHG
jgi:hypothetical protein